ncbi:hypothetical protein SAMN05216553_113213 [Lentzea fradiae]|uniref:Uncharacterized protein n=1 Tax=Lentzea fradiae TaxID=200378 RepID=A0A1G7YBR8_9PSEU|nr:hypothetical protein [Lentzea fradiae]SDG93962.1 hypothetical protein SAMN05216553_113213 [Lentzea fradiae]
MTEWTPEALKAEIDYRHRTARCNWQRSNSQPSRSQRLTGPSWIKRVIHRTSRKHEGAGA